MREACGAWLQRLCAAADPDAEAIQAAALLHEFTEMLLWCHAPTLALAMRRRQLAEPGLRSAAVQRRVLNVELADLERGLMQAWHLPEFLADITDARNAHLPRVVVAAVRNLVRVHTAFSVFIAWISSGR